MKKVGPSLYRALKCLALVCAGILLVACNASNPSRQGSSTYSVGPRTESPSFSTTDSSSPRLSVLIPIFDPNIPKNSDDYAKEGVWPELRRAEANRFAVQLRDALIETGAFDSVRVSPDDKATGHLYVQGKILKSNGEDVKIGIEVIDISGRRLSSKTFSYRVKDYDLQNPRAAGSDLYEPIFQDAASRIALDVKKIDAKRAKELIAIEEIRFAEYFSPEYFSKYLRQSKKTSFQTEETDDIGLSSNRKKMGGLNRPDRRQYAESSLAALPADGDPMLERVRALRIRDQMLIDNLQGDYDLFRNQMDRDYLVWQKEAFLESKALREARRSAITKKIIGALAIVAGAAAAANSSYYDPAPAAMGAVAIAAGASMVSAGMSDSRDAKMYQASFNELGKRINFEVAPRVMQMEDKTVDLKGTASEQYTAWRNFLYQFYEKEKTPDVIL